MVIMRFLLLISALLISKIETSEKGVKCSKVADVLDYCSSEHVRCIKQQTPATICSYQINQCVMKEKFQDADCQKVAENFLRKFADSQNADEVPVDLISSWASGVQSSLNLLKDCQPEVEMPKEIGFVQAIQNIKMLNKLITGPQCSAAKGQFDDHLVNIDEKTSLQLPVPFDRFHCGWSLGYIGKVFFRQIISASCGHFSIKINQCCATHMNCHLLDKNDTTLCDEKYQKCQQEVVAKMSTWKTSCERFQSESAKTLHLMVGDLKTNMKQNFKTEIRVFDGVLEQAVTASDIAKFHVTDLQVFELKSSSHISSKISHFFDKDIYKQGWKKRIIIDSCGLMFEDCQYHDDKGVCLKKLLTCLNDIDDKTEEFEKAVKEFGTLVSTNLDETITKSWMETMVKDQIHHFNLIFAAEYLAISFIIWLLKKGVPFTYRQCGQRIKAFRHRRAPDTPPGQPRAQPPAQQEGIPLVPFPINDQPL